MLKINPQFPLRFKRDRRRIGPQPEWAVACCTSGGVGHACRIQILSSRIRLASRATALRRGHDR